MPTGKMGNYTADVVARSRPKVYRAVANYLAEGFSANKITKLCSVHFRTVNAIRLREATSVDERKKQLVSLLGNVAQLGGERVEQTIGKASTRDAIIGTGVAVDKMLALLGQSPAVQIANVILPTEAEREERRVLHDKLDEIAKRLSDSKPNSPE